MMIEMVENVENRAALDTPTIRLRPEG